MLKLKGHRGITLIALVITIIVLLILVGITVAQLSENGLFNKTQLAKEKYSFAEAQEKLELEISNLKMEMYLNSNGSQVTLNDLKTYLEDPKFEGEYEVEISYEPLAAEVTQTIAYYATVTHRPTQFKFYVDGKLIVVGGETGETLKPTFKNVEEGVTKIKVTMSSAGAVEYKYYKSLDGIEYELIETSESNVYQFTGLTMNTKYYIKVSAKDKDNNEEVSKKEITTKTPTLNVGISDTISSTTLRITTTVPDREDSGITGYIYYVYEGETEVVKSSLIENEYFDATGLTKGTTYTIYAEAYNSAGNKITSANTETYTKLGLYTWEKYSTKEGTYYEYQKTGTATLDLGTNWYPLYDLESSFDSSTGNWTPFDSAIGRMDYGMMYVGRVTNPSCRGESARSQCYNDVYSTVYLITGSINGYGDYNADVYSSYSTTGLIKGDTKYEDVKSTQEDAYPDKGSQEENGVLYWYVKKP